MRDLVNAVDESHIIDSAMQQFEKEQVHDPDFCILKRFIRYNTDVLDIGANRGQSLISLRLISTDCAIHSFEANPILANALKCIARWHNAMSYSFGLGESNSTIPLYIPWVGNDCYLEEASIRRDYYDLPWVADRFADRGVLELDMVDIQIRIGDELALQPSVIKVDVEGAELGVLRGLERTLRRCQPALLVENSDYQNVTAFLHSFGYSPYMVTGDTFAPLDRACTNTLYLTDVLAKSQYGRPSTHHDNVQP